VRFQRILLVHAAATLFMTGVIWFVQVVHYPLFSELGAGLAGYEVRNMRLTTWLVAGPMLVELVTGLVIGARPPRETPSFLAWSGLALLGIIWASTALLQAPQHARLATLFEPETLRLLVATNWLRTVAWTARAVLVLHMLDRSARQAA
jgi:hypothetical protein